MIGRLKNGTFARVVNLLEIPNVVYDEDPSLFVLLPLFSLTGVENYRIRV